MHVMLSLAIVLHLPVLKAIRFHCKGKQSERETQNTPRDQTARKGDKIMATSQQI